MKMHIIKSLSEINEVSKMQENDEEDDNKTKTKINDTVKQTI